MDPPTVFLPPSKNIPLCSHKQLSNVLNLLHQIFIPEVRGSVRRRANSAALNTVKNSYQVALESIRSDPFERSFSIQWLTRFISSYVQEPSTNQEDPSSLTERAAAILAICAGAAAFGAFTRTFTFQTNVGVSSSLPANELSVIIRDTPLESSDRSDVGAQTWGGSCILSELITESPEAFGISPKTLTSQASLQVLELGAGTGLTSITYVKMLQQMKKSFQISQRPPGFKESQVHISVVATDFHPSVFSNLCFNLAENFPEQRETVNRALQMNCLTCDHFPLVRASLLDWAKVYEAEFNQSEEEKHWIYKMAFDVILGTDIIYEDLHAVWIRSCIRHFLRKPSHRLWNQGLEAADFQRLSQNSIYPLFHLILPLRGTHVKESQKVEVVFPRSESVLAERRTLEVNSESVPWDLAIFSQEDITCDAFSDEEKDVVYRYYRIGWM